MIQGFEQFINESFNDQRPLSVHEAINEPFSEFVSTAHERMNTFTSRINELLHDMDVAIETAQEELADVIVGEPIISVDKYLSDISVTFHTNVPNNDEAWAADESPALDLERRLDDLSIDNRNEVQVEIYYKPDEDGNCIIILRENILDEDNFGEYTDALTKFGE